nr:MFS transporter [Brevibacterium album]
MGGNIINAPLDWIREEFAATDSRVVLAVAAYTIAMAVCVPLAGWLCDRFGAIRVVSAGLALMALAQVLAIFSASLEMLIALRAVQGMACATYPPGVQRVLVALWPEKGASALGAWAAAIGVGQALGPPVGGLVAQMLGWRGVFGFSALFSALLLVIVLTTVPRLPGRRVPLHVPGMVLLMAAVGLLVVTVTLVGQRSPWSVDAVVGGAAVVCGVVFLVLAGRHPESLVPPRLLVERRYVRATALAVSSMLILGVLLSSLPLWLAQVLGLGPGPVGLIVFSMAAAMAVSAKLTGAVRSRLGGWRTVVGALSTMLGVLVALGLWLDEGPAGSARRAAEPGAAGQHAGDASGGGASGWDTAAALLADPRTVQVAGIVLLLLLLGAALNAGQSLAAFSVSQSRAGENSLAFGLHNTVRFAGLAVGFAWTALLYPLGSMLLLNLGAVAGVLVALVLVAAGGPLPGAPAPRPASDR